MPQTIMVIHSVGAVIVSEWHDHEHITAILWAGLPGQESGNVLIDIIYGKVNPSGKLPFTVSPFSQSYGSQLLYEPNNSDGPPQQDISGLDIDYRHFDAKNLMPIYEFGFGLSYTSFSYSDLQLSRLDSKPYTPTTGLARPAPDAESNSSTDYAQYLFPPPSEVPH